MLINIKHLDKHKLFAALYNYACGKDGVNYGQISLDEAKVIIDTYKTDFSNTGSLYFDYFDAKRFLKLGDGSGFGASPMKIDLSYTVTDTKRYDDFYGEGKAEELINELRKEKIEELVQLLTDDTAPLPTHLVGASDRELIDPIKELRVEVQNYERINKGPTSQSKNAKSSSSCRLM